MESLVENQNVILDAEFEEIPNEKEKNSEKRSESKGNFTTIQRT